MIPLLLVLFVVLYYYVTRNFNYWSDRNVKHPKPIPVFGNHFTNLFGYKSIVEVSVELYNRYPNEKIIGYYRGNTPELIIKDPDIVRTILTADFEHFYVRGHGRNPDIELMLLSLFHVEGDKWKLLRKRLTPAFTTSKLKNMFPLVVRCAEKLQELAENVSEGDKTVDVRELMAKFTTEFIGACGFGIEMDTISNEQSEFRELGKEIFTPRLSNILKNSVNEIFPEISKNIYVGKKSIENKMIQIFTQIRQQRNNKPIGRNDFVDLLLELEAKGKIVGDSIEKSSIDSTPVKVELEMSIPCMAAQLFVFFAAGFETSSSATSYTLHQLAYNPEVQNKVHEEIDSVMTKYDNKLSYDALEEMPYLDMTFKEAMRMFPSLACLNRVCTKKYTIPELGVTIDPGVKILIPIQAIQNDERYFDNPSEFRPERFSPENVKDRHKFVYLPFGDGPRACIGARLGHMQSLAGLASLLHKFKVEPAPETTKSLKVNTFSNIVQSVKNGIPLLLKRR